MNSTDIRNKLNLVVNKLMNQIRDVKKMNEEFDNNVTFSDMSSKQIFGIGIDNYPEDLKKKQKNILKNQKGVKKYKCIRIRNIAK